MKLISLIIALLFITACNKSNIPKKRTIIHYTDTIVTYNDVFLYGNEIVYVKNHNSNADSLIITAPFKIILN